MVIGSPRRIQPEVLELLKKLPCARMEMKVNEVIKKITLFCLDCPKEFEKWEKKQLKQKKQR